MGVWPTKELRPLLKTAKVTVAEWVTGSGFALIGSESLKTRFCSGKVQHGARTVSFLHGFAGNDPFSRLFCRIIDPYPKASDPFSRLWAQKCQKPAISAVLS